MSKLNTTVLPNRNKSKSLLAHIINKKFSILLIVVIALIIRVFCLVYTIIWSKLINNYKFSNDILCSNVAGSKNEGNLLWKYIKCFSYWDGEYFLKLSLNKTEYVYEQNHAFFPTLPLIIIFLSNILQNFVTNIDINACSINTLLAIVVNNFFFILGTIGIYLFPIIYFYYNLKKTKEKLENDENVLYKLNEHNNSYNSCYYLTHIKDEQECNKFSFFLSILYTFNIGNIHVSSFYNESIFSCFSIWGFNFLHLSLISYNKINFFFEILTVLCFFIACLFRSNGILFLIPLFFFNVHSCDFLKHCYKLFLYSTVTEKKKKNLFRNIFSYFNCKKHIFFFILHWLKALIEALIIISPFLFFQLYAYKLYCSNYSNIWKEQNKTFYNFSVNFIKQVFIYLNMLDANVNDNWMSVNSIDVMNNINKHTLVYRPWCKKRIPFIYNYIQHKYWDVFFLKNLIKPDFNILYSAPIYYIAFHSIVNFFKNNKYILFNPFIGSIVHLCVFTSYILLCAHNEIILRLIISCPMFYLHYAYLLKYYEKWNYLFFVNLLFFFIGPPLFGTYIAWT
ncbi:GPI mannosyltransferase 2, putative [Hepatocystis sp. ex Piliocolobus tephrosceles]|nr:GPI mannosyltransferase 2, putative [Hepatocystis sp. ex Piliocolobus tephrosceles]